MGMFDRIWLKTKCPYCGEISRMEFQTKDGGCYLDDYEIGDIFDNGQYRFIDATGTCESFICQLEAAKESVWTNGYYGGFSRSFDVLIECDSKGKIKNKFKITNYNYHKGILKGILGELKGKEDNMKVVKYRKWDDKRKKFTEPVMKKMTTNGWLDKFRTDNDALGGGITNYQNIMYLYNLEDGVEAFKLWFIFRWRLDDVINYIKESLNLNDSEIASVFLSNDVETIYGVKNEMQNL